MTEFGGQGLAFDTIAVAGTHSSQPHGRPSDYVLADGDFLTLDFGAAYEGYCSDMTRTVAIGHATDEMRLVYGTVLEAQQRAIEMIAAGVSCREVDALARSVMQNRALSSILCTAWATPSAWKSTSSPACRRPASRRLRPAWS